MDRVGDAICAAGAGAHTRGGSRRGDRVRQLYLPGMPEVMAKQKPKQKKQGIA